MKLLVIGSGGREHALVWKLAQSPHVTRLWCAPGNAGIATERLARTDATVENVPLGADDLGALLAFAREQRPDLTVVGPDNPLSLGIVDQFQAAGFRIWGPNQRAAQFESSKVFAQEFMERHGIPAPQAGTFTDPSAAGEFARRLGGRCAVKADGLALGKGVIICRTPEEAGAAINGMLVQQTFGAASRRIVIQELIEGVEISLHALCDGRRARLFPTSQDHKRALDADQGPNTGGMGAYSPARVVTPQVHARIMREVIQPTIAGMAKDGLPYTGFLYAGVMIDAAGNAKTLEFNCRMGDPETQVYLPRLENDLVELLDACVNQTLHQIELK